ncbi:Gfo/Idh/MocA family protein (plasmid) [Legionella sp. D16C41]|uniref:Gfo/Idh/MocA family protein n=1 Tax=Legionella sp. D16C41 TaxID=3402688 RepID=UPI003AF69555
MKEIRYGIIGGGPGSMMGNVHRLAAQQANYRLVCGAFSRSMEKATALKKELNLNDLRLYSTCEEMLIKEAKLPEDKRMQIVSILTPNYLHFAAASQALSLGFHVILEKPITLTLAEAKELQLLAHKYQKQVCVNYTYSGYAKIQEARSLIEQGLLGKIRKVEISFHQDWLYKNIEKESSQAAWRTDPTQSGLAGSAADIGTHAFHLAEYITGLKVQQLCALSANHVEGRKVDDDTSTLIKFSNGATGIISVMQMAIGENNLNITIYGERRTIKWEFDQRNLLKIYTPKPSSQLFKPVESIMLKDSDDMELDYQATAAHYTNFAQSIYQSSNNAWYPNLMDGLRGMIWIESVLKSQNSQQWINLEEAETNVISDEIINENSKKMTL